MAGRLRAVFLSLVMGYFVAQIFAVPVTTDFSARYSGASFFVVSIVLALTGYPFHTALGEQKVFAGKLLEE